MSNLDQPIPHTMVATPNSMSMLILNEYEHVVRLAIGVGNQWECNCKSMNSQWAWGISAMGGSKAILGDFFRFGTHTHCEVTTTKCNYTTFFG